MKQGAIETIAGLIVILITAAFFKFAYSLTYSTKTKDSYTLEASFQSTDGLEQGNDVKLAGIKIGYVESIKLEKDTYFAVVKLRIDKEVPIPVDSRAIVATTSLIGGKYINIVPGASEENLTDNSKMQFTQSALNIEELIGKLIYSFTGKQ